MNNEPIYKINGLERRKVKKHLSDKDMYSFYSPDDNSMMSDANAQLLYDSKIEEIDKITAELDEPYKSIADIRNEK